MNVKLDVLRILVHGSRGTYGAEPIVMDGLPLHGRQYQKLTSLRKLLEMDSWKVG